VVLAGVVICAALAFAFHRSERQRALADLERQQELEQLRQELDSIKDDHASRAKLTQQLVRAGRDERGSRSAQDAEGDEAAAGEEQDEQESDSDANKPEMTDEEMKTVVLASVFSTFDAEQNDAAWSTGANRQLTQAVNAGLPKGSRVEKVECKSTLCKVDTHHKDLDEFRSFVQDAILSRERQVWNGGSYSAVIEQSDHGVTAVTYLAKEGQSVPYPEI